MHELEGPRRSCAPCQAAIARHRPAAPDCSTSRRPRLLVACLTRNGCPEVPGSRSLGSRSSVDCPPRSHPADRSVARPSVDVSAAVSPGRSLGRASFDGLPRVGSRSRLLGSRSCAERVPRMALRCRSLGSGSCAERVSRRPCLDHSRPASAGLPRLVTPRLLGAYRRGTGPCSLAGDCSPVHVSEPITDLENSCRIAVSRVPPRSGSHLPDRPPFPATWQVVVVEATARQGLGDHEFEEFLHPQAGPQAGPGLSPGHHQLSTGSSTEPSTSPRRRVQHVDVRRAVQSSRYGQCRQPRPQHVPLSARNRAVRTNSPLAGSR
jgi:hypothetical protein